jgi:hypothetical protein
MRVRKVVTRSGKKFRGKFPSRKLGRMVQWESLLERDAILALEYLHEVATYQEQPSVEIYYDGANQPRRYVPDFRAEFADGRELLVEVKPENQISTKEIREKLGAIAKRLEEQGRHYRVLTENDIRREPFFGNLRRLHSSGRRLMRASCTDALVERLGGGPVWTISEAAEQIGGIEDVLRLVATGRLRIDLHAPIAPTSLVWLPDTEGDRNGSFLL